MSGGWEGCVVTARADSLFILSAVDVDDSSLLVLDMSPRFILPPCGALISLGKSDGLQKE